MMNVVDVLYVNYYDFSAKKPLIGGVQTYITFLSRLIERMGWKCRIFQISEEEFCYDLSEYITIYGVVIRKCKAQYEDFVTHVISTRDNENKYITLYATNNIIPKKKLKHSIAIQHGICWDIISKKTKTLSRQILGHGLTAWKIVRQIENVESLVCVDYNFINWYRCQLSYSTVKMHAIPNFTRIPAVIEKPNGIINIIYARRLYDYRGTRLFADVAEKIVNKYNNVHICIAGTGPELDYLKKRFKEYGSVEFTCYESEESLTVHAKHHIAVVPSLGSEGTSLSLLEAMASSCAVVCTNVGGMTNIVLDGYNGRIVNPEVDELYYAIEDLILHEAKRNEISRNGRHTVEMAFSLDKWEERWMDILNSIIC